MTQIHNNQDFHGIFEHQHLDVYRVALASAAECAAALDLLAVYQVQGTEDGRCLVNRVGAMLRRMAR